MHERDMSENSGALDFDLRMSQADAQRAVAALHLVRADDDWVDDNWAGAGGEQADGAGVEWVNLSGTTPGGREGDLAASSGGRQ